MIFGKIPIREISTLVILVPLIISGSYFLTAGIKLRLFFIFLLIGLATDLFGWYVSFNLDLIRYLFYISAFYSVLEALFFTWWVSSYATVKSIKKIGQVTITITIFWLVFIIFYRIDFEGSTSRLLLFDAFYQITVSFLSGFTLLTIIENEEKPSNLPIFWILIGVFFYCFSTFFVFVIKSTLHNEMADRLWPVHNIVNIFTYMLYSVGLWKYRSINKA